MEVKIYDKNGDVIASENNTEGNNLQGHYDIELTDEKNGLQFVPKKTDEDNT